MDSSFQAHLSKTITQCYRQDGQYQAVPATVSAWCLGPGRVGEQRGVLALPSCQRLLLLHWLLRCWVNYWLALRCYDPGLDYFLSLRDQGPLDPTPGPPRIVFLMVVSVP